MLKHTVSISIKGDSGGRLAADSKDYEAAAEVNFDQTADSLDTLEIDANIDVSQIVSFYIYSDKNVTLKTNDTSAPTQTIAITAKKLFWWNTDHSGTNPLTADVTKFFFVNAGADDAKIKGAFLLDVDS
jgi:hypothetical protein